MPGSEASLSRAASIGGSEDGPRDSCHTHLEAILTHEDLPAPQPRKPTATMVVSVPHCPHPTPTLSKPRPHPHSQLFSSSQETWDRSSPTTERDAQEHV